MTYESIEQLFKILETNQEKLSKFTFVYYPPIDLVGHVYGSNSLEYCEEVKLFEKNFESSLRKLKGFTIILTSELLSVYLGRDHAWNDRY